MRDSVAEVGVAGSTFERVAGKAGVSRGLLHYYFGTKEKLLVEVVRRDTEIRIETFGEELSRSESADELILAFFTAFRRTIEEELGYIYMVSELFIAARHSEELSIELGSLYRNARIEFTKILEQKARDGVIQPRFSVDSVLSYLFAAGDGFSVQTITDPGFDPVRSLEVSYGVAKYLLTSE